MNAERKNFVYGNKEENIPGCIARGISEEAANKVYDDMIDFAKYAFNRSHAAAYATVSYQSAWLKFHYPKEFLIEVLNQEKSENIPLFIDECKKMGYTVLGPDINRSEENFTEIDGSVIYGLSKVKSVKDAGRQIVSSRGSGYKSFADFLMNGGANKTAVKMLIMGGAFDNFCSSRQGLLLVLDDFLTRVKKIRDLEKRISLKEEKVLKGDKTKRLKNSLENDMQSYEKAKDELYSLKMPTMTTENIQKKLKDEKTALFTYVSISPLDEFEVALKKSTPIIAAEVDVEMTLTGMISESKVFHRKKDQKQMAVFNLNDRTGSIKVVCWPKILEQCKDLIVDDRVVTVSGKVKRDKGNEEDLVVTPYFVKPASGKRRQILFMKRSEKEWEGKVSPLIKQYEDETGHRVLVYDTITGQIEITEKRVSASILQEEIDGSFVKKYLSH